ncbi:diacylglycerol kinase family protein [Ethanoligenens harbinense]|uniref:Diacylglycerol kinase n=1 Tax=Ethanoligenens harbinense (strain DSM 18485 / JCM 12961 / CGMCC 1.5033 / YUAN-3) TaxID=663278 RepID=E6U535_ETHHY|nr:diacylglycerol kinase family protein [Ethanoligenens harbinense]ADU26741.1 diacylglycerol kinase [Ethanoligenens harbinense YUAN-3]
MPQRIRSLHKSFRDAFRGVAFCVKNERNMRIHMVVGAYMLCFSPFFHLSAAEYAVLLLTIALVLFAETVNTAIEAVINLQAQWYDNLARIGKDVAAGAVLICAFLAAVVGFVLFFHPATLLFIIEYLFSHLFFGFLFLVSLPLSGVFIFFFPFNVRKH